MSNEQLGVSLENGTFIKGIGLLIVIIVYVVYFRKKQLSFIQKIAYFLLGNYFVFVFGIVFTPIPLNEAAIIEYQTLYSDSSIYDSLSLIPFHNFYLEYYYLRHLFLNIVMLMPFGFLISLYHSNLTIKRVIWYSLFFSLTIELIQLGMSLLFKAPLWIFDVNDLIMNTLGGLVGALLYKFIIQIQLRAKS